MSRVVTPPTSQPAATTNQIRVPHEKIAMRAYEKWCKRGRPTGSSQTQDWLEAEAELRAEAARSASSSMPSTSTATTTRR